MRKTEKRPNLPVCPETVGPHGVRNGLSLTDALPCFYCNIDLLGQSVKHTRIFAMRHYSTQPYCLPARADGLGQHLTSCGHTWNSAISLSCGMYRLYNGCGITVLTFTRWP